MTLGEAYWNIRNALAEKMPNVCIYEIAKSGKYDEHGEFHFDFSQIDLTLIEEELVEYAMRAKSFTRTQRTLIQSMESYIEQVQFWEHGTIYNPCDCQCIKCRTKEESRA